MLFTNDDYIVEAVKSIDTFEPKRWLESFKKSLTRNIVEANILHTSSGLTLPIKRFSSNPQKQTIEFAGLHAYTAKSKLLRELLNELYGYIQDEVITRIDVAIDFKGKVPSKVIKTLQKSRTPFTYINTCYLKTDKERKTNSHINICIYPKHKKVHLDYEVERLEFSFKGSYFRGQFKVNELDSVLLKMQKTIKRFTGLDVVIQSLSGSL